MRSKRVPTISVLMVKGEGCYFLPSNPLLTLSVQQADLALFPQGSRFEGRRAGAPPTVEAGKPKGGGCVPACQQVSAHGTRAHRRTA